MALSDANIFMEKLERQIITQAQIQPHTWWCYIDNIFMIWTEEEDSPADFIDYLDSAYRMIKFTSKWSYKEVEFLDV